MPNQAQQEKRLVAEAEQGVGGLEGQADVEEADQAQGSERESK